MNRFCWRCHKILPKSWFSHSRKYLCGQCAKMPDADKYMLLAKRILKKYKNDRKLLIYGITQDIYNKLLAKQNSVCWICGRPAKTISLNIDHNHNKNKGTIRGLLCFSCNKYVIGRSETPDIFLKAAEYLNSQRLQEQERQIEEWRQNIFSRNQNSNLGRKLGK